MVVELLLGNCPIPTLCPSEGNKPVLICSPSCRADNVSPERIAS